jgi:hypothetical protein
MAGSLSAHTAGGAQDAGDEAVYVVSGTGTSNDGKRVRGVAAVDPATGLPGSPGGGGGGGGAVTVADGADVVQGAVADAIVSAGAVGTFSAKLRRATQGLEDLKSLIVLAAGANIIGKVGVDQTTPGTTNLVAARTNVYRNAGVLHRSAIAAVDKLSAPAALSSLSAPATGSLSTGTTYYVAATAGNVWGVTTLSNAGTPQTQATGGSGTAVQFTLAQVTGATYYDLFLSTDVGAPKWVCRITETQRADANGVLVTAVGVSSAGSSLGAGVIQIRVAGTGQTTAATLFSTITAYTPASVTPISCAGYSRAHVKGVLTLTGFGATAPALTLVPFFGNQVAGSNVHAGQAQPVPILTGSGQSLQFEMVVELDGETAFSVLIDTLAGTGAAVSLWVELA